MDEKTIEGGTRRPGSAVTIMDLAAQHDDPYGFAADNDLDIVGAEQVGADAHWRISYLNKQWSAYDQETVALFADSEEAFEAQNTDDFIW